MVLMGQAALSDCAYDCKQLTDKADKIIAEQQKTIDLYKQKDAQQTKNLVDLSTSLDDKTAQLSAWYRNPFIVGTLGLLVGAAGATYLLRK